MQWDAKTQNELWDAEAAARYDTPGEGRFAAEEIGPTVERLAELAGGGRALEFAIGTGRVAVPLAECGVPVVGIEYSRHMIDRLRQKVNEDAIPVLEGDMATTRADGEFALVYLVYNTIGNLVDQDRQVACFRNAAAHLAVGGRFLIELQVPPLRTMPPGTGGAIFAADPNAVLSADAGGYVGLDLIDTVSQLLVSHHFRFDADGRTRLFRTPQRYVWPAELDLMGQLAGFELESRHSGWRHEPFTAESPSHVSVYRKLPPAP